MNRANKDSDGQVISSAASVYEAFFVPALFGEWSPRLADALSLRANDSALDVACGTGVLARELSRRAEPTTVYGVDCNEGMLAVARTIEPRIKWRTGRAEALPFEADRFQAVGSQFGLMFFEDKQGALAEMWRVLAPGGRLAVAVWGSLSDTPGYAAMVELLAKTFGHAIASELKAPFSLGDVDRLRALFSAAQINDVRIDRMTGAARFPSIDAWVYTDIRGWTLADKLDDAQCALLVDRGQHELARFVVDDGRVEFASPAYLVTARKPHP